MRTRFLCLLAACVVVSGAGCVGGPRQVSREHSTGQEISFQLERIVFTQVPASGPPNATVTVCWRVNGTGTIPETSVLTDTAERNSSTYGGPTYYPDNASGPVVVSLPNDFCTGVKLPATGDLFLRAYARGNAKGTSAPRAEEALSVPETISVNEST